LEETDILEEEEESIGDVKEGTRIENEIRNIGYSDDQITVLHIESDG